MAFVINRNQQVYTAGMYPIAAYSRIVSVELALFEGWGLLSAVTPVVGNNVWLLGVKVFKRQEAPDSSQFNFFGIYAGGPGDVSVVQILEWPSVLPKLNSIGQPAFWQICDGKSEMSWQFKKRYEGDGRRFALLARRYGESHSLLQVSFHISEG